MTLIHHWASKINRSMCSLQRPATSFQHPVYSLRPWNKIISTHVRVVHLVSVIVLDISSHMRRAQAFSSTRVCYFCWKRRFFYLQCKLHHGPNHLKRNGCYRRGRIGIILYNCQTCLSRLLLHCIRDYTTGWDVFSICTKRTPCWPGHFIEQQKWFEVLKTSVPSVSELVDRFAENQAVLYLYKLNIVLLYAPIYSRRESDVYWQKAKPFDTSVQ